MFEILRDPLWQFIGAVLALVAIIVSVFLYRRQRRNKELSYEIISNTALLTMEEDVRQKMQILFNGKPMEQVYLVVLRIVNSGNLPILTTDYVRPVSLSFGEEAQILTAEIAETNPRSLHASAKIDGKRVVILPTLLNQGDTIKLKMLVGKSIGQITVDGRIVGVKDIKKTRELVYPLVGLVLTTISTILILIGFASIGLNSVLGRPVDPLHLLCLVVGYVIVCAIGFTDPRLRRFLSALFRREREELKEFYET